MNFANAKLNKRDWVVRVRRLLNLSLHWLVPCSFQPSKVLTLILTIKCPSWVTYVKQTLGPPLHLRCNILIISTCTVIGFFNAR